MIINCQVYIVNGVPSFYFKPKVIVFDRIGTHTRRHGVLYPAATQASCPSVHRLCPGMHLAGPR